MASFADIQSAWQAGANPPPPPPPDDGSQAPVAPTMTVMPPKAMVTGTAPTSFADIQKAWSDKSPPPADFKDDNGPSGGAIAKDMAKQAGSSLIEGPVMMTVGAPGDADQAAQPGGAFEKAGLGLAHRFYDWTGYGPQAGTPERERFDRFVTNLDTYVNNLDPTSGKLPTTQGILNAVGIQLPEPETAAGRYTRMAGDFAAGALTGETPALATRAVQDGVVPAVTQAAKVAAPAAASGLGAQGATDLAEATDNKDLAPIAQIAGAALTHGAVAGGAAGLSKVADSPTVANALTVTPLFRKMGANMQEDIAARRLAGSISDLPAFLEQLKPKPDGDSAIPGFNPTTYQVTGDPGIGQLELQARQGEGRAQQFVERQDQQKAAQAQAAQGLTTPGDPSAVAQMVENHLSDIDAATDQAHDAARSAAQQQTDAIGTGQTPDEVGADLRSHLDTASAASKQAYRSFYSAVNPDGTLGADTTGIAAAADRIYGQMSPTTQALLSPTERTFAGILDQYQPTMPFNEVVELKSELAEALRAARATPGQARAVARMSSLMGPVQDAISGSVKERAADEAQAVSAGQMAPEDTMEAQVGALRNKWDVNVLRERANASTGLARTGTGLGGVAEGAPPRNLGTVGTASPASGRVGQAASDPGVPPQAGGFESAAPRPVTPAHQGPLPQSLITFLQRAGGVRDQGGNLKAAGYDRFPGLITRTGHPLDRAREMAAEARYLGADTDHAVANTDVNDLLDAIGSHPRYSVHDEGTVAAREQRAKEVAYQKEFAAARRTISDGLKRDHDFRNTDIDQNTLNKATYIAMEQNLAPLDAYELALRRDAEHDEAQRQAAHAALDQDIPFDDLPRSPGADASGSRHPQAGDAPSAGRGSGAPYADGAQPPPGGAGQAPGSGAFRLPTPADAANLRAADAAFKAHVQTYGEGPLKDIMAPGKRAGEYRTPDYAVPAKVLRNGPAGYRTVRAFLDGAGNTPEAVDSLKGAMADTLRAKIKDGLLPPDALAAWKNRQAHALRAVDEASPGFSSQFDNVAKASDAVLESSRAKAEQSRAFKASAAGKFLGASTDEAVIERVGNIIKGQDGVAKMRQLMQAAEKDPAAAAGVRNAAGQWLTRQFTTDDKIGTTGENVVGVKQFRKLFDQRAPVLREVLTPDQIDVAGRIAETMDQAQRSVKGNRLEGGSDTAQKLAENKLFKKEGKGSHATDFGLMGMLAEGAAIGFEHSGLKGAVLGAAPAGAGWMMKTLRTAGLHGIQDIVFDALMNPDRARQLMKRLSPNDFRERRLDGALRASFIRQADDDKDGSRGGGAPNEPPPTGPFSRDGSRARAIDVHGPADLEPARARVDANATPAQTEAGNHRMGHVVVDGMPVSIQAPKGSMRSGVGRDGKPWSAQMPADYGYFKGSKGADGEHVDTYIGERPSQGVAHIVDQVDPDTRRFDEHKVILNAGDAAHARELYKQAFSDGRGEQRIGGVTPISTDALKDWLGTAQPKRPYATSRFARQNPARVEPTLHPDAEATHQAILAHEQRLKTKLGPDASIKDIADATKRASDDVLAMVRASPERRLRWIEDEGDYHLYDLDGDHETPLASVAQLRDGAYRVFSGGGEHVDVAGLDDAQALAEKRVASSSPAPTPEAGSPSKPTKHTIYRPGDVRFADDMQERDLSGVPRRAWTDGEHFHEGETYGYDAARIKDGDRIHSVVRNIDFENDQGKRVKAADALTRVQMYKLKRSLAEHERGILETHAEEETSKSEWANMSRAEQRAELARQEQERQDADRRKTEDINSKVDAAVASGWRPTVNQSGGWRQPAELKEFASPSSFAKIAARLLKHGIDLEGAKRRARAEGGDVLASTRQAASARPVARADAGLALHNPRTGASVKAQSSISLGGALERYDVSRDPGADNLQRVSHLAVGDRVSRLAGNTPVFVVGPNEMRTLAEGRLKVDPGHEPAGFYDPESGHIIALDDAMRDPREASRLMLHEGLHAALMRTIDGSPNLREMVDHLRLNASAVHFERGGEASDHYGLKNAHEFMSEAMSNPEFQRFLASIPADSRLVRAYGLQGTARTMWDAFVGAMRRVLGVAPGDHTYLDAAMRAGWDALDMAEAEKAAAHPPLPAAAAPPRTPAPAPTRPRSPPGQPSIGAMQDGSPLLSMLATMMAHDHRNVPVQNYR